MPFPRGPEQIQRNLGKWYDGPRMMPIWYVCEKVNTSSDLCEAEGWSSFENSCYVMSHDRKSYDEAALACKELGAQLVVINSHVENTHVQKLSERKTLWIGLAEPADSEEWFWADGKLAGKDPHWSGYTNWDGSEPNNYNGVDEDAAFMNLWFLLGMPEPWAVH